MELHHGMGGVGGGGGVLIGGGERVGVMLVCGKNVQISAKKGEWVIANGPKKFHRRSRKFFPGPPPPLVRHRKSVIRRFSLVVHG